MGKRMEANKIAREEIARICEEFLLERCELCGGTYGIAPAHKERRDYYRGDWRALSDYKNWICLCVICHERMDNRAKTTVEQKNEIFKRLRP
jgi:predicted restriction endonuclease